MCGKDEKYGGFLLAEVVVTLAILGLLLGSLAISLSAFANANHHQLMKQRCVAAGQAQLESITITGRAVPDEDFKRLWPGLSVSMETSEGCGQWQGLKLVEVTTSGKSFRKEVKVRLSRYISGESIFHGGQGQERPVEEER